MNKINLNIITQYRHAKEGSKKNSIVICIIQRIKKKKMGILNYFIFLGAFLIFNPVNGIDISSGLCKEMVNGTNEEVRNRNQH